LAKLVIFQLLGTAVENAMSFVWVKADECLFPPCDWESERKKEKFSKELDIHERILETL